MSTIKFLLAPYKFAALACALMISSICVAADNKPDRCAQQFSPRSGQAGKDVIWVPTLDELVSAMLKAAKVGPSDYVIDLGSGDGKIPIAAAKQFGARALGVEYNPQMVQLARCYVRNAGLNDRVRVIQGDIFQTDFSEATVLTLYLLSDLNLKLRPRILDLKPGTRVVSNTFKMGEWSPDEFIESEIGNTRAYLWIVPAKIEGTWQFQEEGGVDNFSLQFKQHYQELQATISSATPPRTIRDARLRGVDLELSFGEGTPPRLQGKVQGNSIRLIGTRDGRDVIYLGTRNE
ncbi:MAG TPA: methyltransferase domain-containing protein [Steroidobacteraceae bacterium]|nr:methyltransferase domain-containing protein [Steroidobacteraceae bacterium]